MNELRDGEQMLLHELAAAQKGMDELREQLDAAKQAEIYAKSSGYEAGVRVATEAQKPTRRKMVENLC